MRFMFPAVSVLLLVSCSDVRSFEDTSAQFERDRDGLPALAGAVFGCEEASHFLARDTDRADCVGDISRELHRLGYKSASVEAGGWRVYFVNGDDGTGRLGVTSGITYRRMAGSPQGEQPLTGPPHQWFYFQRD
jgi:hypothetical protein